MCKIFLLKSDDKLKIIKGGVCLKDDLKEEFVHDPSKLKIAFDYDFISENKGRGNLKILLVVAYLRKYATRLGVVRMTIEDLIRECGYSRDRHRGGSDEQFKSILSLLIREGKITYDGDLSALKYSDFIQIKVNEGKLFHAKDNFVLLTIKEFDAITSSNIPSKEVALAVYLLIKKHIYIDDNENSTYAKVAYPSKYGIAKRIGVNSKSTVEVAIERLVSIGMLYEHVGGFYKKENGLFYPTNNVYALTYDDLKACDCDKVLADYYHVEKIYRYGGFDESKLRYPKRGKE